MEGGHLLRRGGMGTVAFHLAVEAVGQDEVVGKLETVRLHWVGRAVVEVSHLGRVEVGYSALRRHGGVVDTLSN